MKKYSYELGETSPPTRSRNEI